MHNINDLKLLKDFVPKGSKLAPQNVFSAGPGANVSDLYRAGAKYGVQTIGGFTASVGAAGGFVLGGGAGTSSP
jgi:hypothetical protein